MADRLEKTDVAQSGHDLAMSKTQVSNIERQDLYGRGDHAQTVDPFSDDEELVCGLENPDECEACN